MTASAIEGSAVPLALVQGEPIAQRSTRALLGWLPDQEGVQYLLGHNPTPLDDLVGVGTRVTNSRAAVQARPPTAIADPVVGGDRLLLDQAAARPEIQAAFPNMRWRVEWVDLTKVLALQKIIVTDGLDLRVADAADSHEALLELCLPAEQPVPPLGAFTDPNGGITVSSLNPNLRVAGAQVQEALVGPSPESPPQRMMAVTFLVSMGTSYVQVARYQGRYFLRDGYHRAAGLLRSGINVVPAIVVEVSSYKDLAPNPGLFDYEIAFSDRAPLLSDFWEDSVSAESLQPALRKVVRLRAEEFGVQG